MTFAQSNRAVGNTIKFLAGLLPALAAGVVFGVVIGVPFAYVTRSGEPLLFFASVGMVIAFCAYIVELERGGDDS